VIAATKDYTQSVPRGIAYWEAVNELIQREPVPVENLPLPSKTQPSHGAPLAGNFIT
jgi:hypothetical protein